MPNCRLTWVIGTSAYNRLLLTTRRGSLVRPKCWNTWQPRSDRQYPHYRCGRTLRRDRVLSEQPKEFVACCERALEDDAGNQARRSHSRSVLSRTSWDRTVAQMVDLVEETLTAKLNRSDRTEQATDALPSSVRCLVVGGGPTGLVLLIICPNRRCSANRTTALAVGVGPLSATASRSILPGTSCSLPIRMSTSCTRPCWETTSIGRIARRVDLQQTGLHALSLSRCVVWLAAAVIKECILGAIEARFGTAVVTDAPPGQGKGVCGCDAPSAKHNGNGHPRINGHKNGSSVPQAAERSLNGRGSPNANPSTLSADRCLQGDVKDCCGDGVLESSAPLKSEAPRSRARSRRRRTSRSSSIVCGELASRGILRFRTTESFGLSR